MPDLTKEAPAPTRIGVVTIIQLANDEILVDQIEGMTARQALTAGGVEVGLGQSVTSDGFNDLPLDSVLKPNAEVVVARNHSNG